MANDFLSSNFLKGLIDVGGQAITVVDTLVNKFGGIQTIIGGTTIGTGIYAFVKDFDCPVKGVLIISALILVGQS